MTTEHEEAVRLADKHSTGSQLFKGGLCWTFNPEDVAALIADVRRQKGEEDAEICKDHQQGAKDAPHKEYETYSDGYLDASNEIEWTIRASLDSPMGKEEGK